MLLHCVLDKTLESPLECKEIQPVYPKADQSWVFFGRTDAEAETPILRPPHVKSWLIWKDPDDGRDWGRGEKRMTEDDMVGWHHRLLDMSLGKFWESVMDREAWYAAIHGSQRVRHDWVTEVNCSGNKSPTCFWSCFPSAYPSVHETVTLIICWIQPVSSLTKRERDNCQW